METYSDLRIVDCNRSNSVQAKTGNHENPALFTNDIGNIKLDVGDEVSVHGGFISEVGAGSDTIEFKGTPILDYKGRPKSRVLKYINETPSYPTRPFNQIYDNVLGGFQINTSIEAERTIPLFDNEATIKTEFYTSNNGQGYIFLPRRYAYNRDYTGNASRADVGELWTDFDDTISGKPFNYPRYQMIIEADYQKYRDGRNHHPEKYPNGLYIPKHDNKRFTIMRRLGQTFYRDQIIRYSHALPPITPSLPTIRDPALSEYRIYEKLVHIHVSKGMNSPSDVSEQITRSLKRSKDPYVFETTDDDGIVQHVSTTFETETWRPFKCGSYDTFGAQYFASYINNTNLDTAYKHFACYENIAVKRPDLFIAGRKCNTYEGNRLLEGIPFINRDIATLKTNILYTPDNLQNLSNLFKVQGLYPELFSGYSFQTYLSNAGSFNDVNNVRFLHMNTETNASQNGMLGNDSYLADPAHLNIEGNDYSSIPVFFRYMPEYADIETGGDDTTKLSYGFAMRYKHSGQFYIELRPDLSSGLTDFNFQHYDSASGVYKTRDIEVGRAIGWDYHFSAYSTLAMILWGGRVDRDYLNNNEWAIQNASQAPTDRHGSVFNVSKLITQRYVGANDPLFDYDSVNNRFYIADLHTAERNGQVDILAGFSSTTAPPINSNFAEKVYKINPRMNRWEYTPDLKPYSEDYNTAFHGGMPSYVANTDIQGFKLFSRQMSPFTIFDTDSGIFINDFGYDEEDFTEGLFGILGFTYDQFNQKVTSNLNRLTRINDDNKNALSVATTNCNIVSSDTEFFNVNNYGAIFMTNQITCPQCIVGPTGFTINGSATTYGQQSVPSYPAITQPTDSIRLTATNLPRKMLRPYYLIKSDIIEQPKYVGNNTALMNIVGICDKQYSGGDFYFGSDNAFTFRITKPRDITQITTSIHDPDGSFANVNRDSAIIYRITKNISVNTNILGDFLSKKKK